MWSVYSDENVNKNLLSRQKYFTSTLQSLEQQSLHKADTQDKETKQKLE